MDAGRKQVPAEAAVADRALEDQDRRVQRVAQLVADAGLDADLAAGDGQPVVAFDAGFARAAAAHHMHVADVLAGGPVARVIDHEGVELFGLDRVFERAFVALDLAHLQRVRLAHDDEHLNGLDMSAGLPSGSGSVSAATGIASSIVATAAKSEAVTSGFFIVKFTSVYVCGFNKPIIIHTMFDYCS